MEKKTSWPKPISKESVLKKPKKYRKMRISEIRGYAIGDKPDIYCIECWGKAAREAAREGKAVTDKVKVLYYQKVKLAGFSKIKTYECEMCCKKLFNRRPKGNRTGKDGPDSGKTTYKRQQT